jgi:TetR/AcrR family transcriptional regulator
MPGKRALREPEKEARKTEILQAAERLFRTGEFEEIKVADIAKEAGLAKGTVFLYFATKEEIFLELLIAEYETWFDGIDALLSGPGFDTVSGWKTAVLEYIGKSMESQETLYRLVAILHPVLERNIGFDAAVRFKTFLSAQIRKTGSLLEAVLPSLRNGKGAVLLVQLHALIVGFSNIARPAPVLRRAIEENDLDEFRVEFKSWFNEAVRIFIDGLV